MSEDDLFLALKRTPFGVMFIMCLGKVARVDRDIISTNKDLLETNGWNAQDFLARLIFELEEGTVDMCISVVNNPEWRKKVLSLNLI